MDLEVLELNKRKKYKAGYFQYESRERNYYTDDFVHFFKSDNTELNQDDLNEWAVWLNSPWSQININYIISVNCEDNCTRINPNNPIWKCKYNIVGYDGVTTGIFGYGDTEISALNECISHLKELEKKYNLNNDSF